MINSIYIQIYWPKEPIIQMLNPHTPHPVFFFLQKKIVTNLKSKNELIMENQQYVSRQFVLFVISLARDFNVHQIPLDMQFFSNCNHQIVKLFPFGKLNYSYNPIIQLFILARQFFFFRLTAMFSSPLWLSRLNLKFHRTEGVKEGRMKTDLEKAE